MGRAAGSCVPEAWCHWRWVTAVTRHGAGQVSVRVAGRLTVGSSLKGAIPVTDEWAVQRARYILETIAPLSDDPTVNCSPKAETGANEVNRSATAVAASWEAQPLCVVDPAGPPRAG